MTKIWTDMYIKDFKPWLDACTTFDQIMEADKMDEFQNLIDILYPEGCDETEINDLLWFERDYLYNILGIECENKDE